MLSYPDMIHKYSY